MADLIYDYKELEFPDGVTSPLLSITYNNDSTVSFTDITQYKNKDNPKCVYINADLINVTNTEINSLASRYSAWIPTYTPLETNLVNAEFSVKKFLMTDIGNNEVTLEDRTTYTQSGSTYNAAKINAANILLMNLQSGYTENVEGSGGLLEFLHNNGATSDDLLEAFNQMENYQTGTAGYNEGIRQVKVNPHAYNCYTQAELQSLQQSNNTLKSKFRAVKSAISYYFNNTLSGSAAELDRYIGVVQSEISLIVGGIPRDTAYSSADSIKNNGDSIRAGANSLVQEYNNNCTTWANNLD